MAFTPKNAQNMIEVLLLAVVVVLTSFYVIGLYNNQKSSLVKLSSVTTNSLTGETSSSVSSYSSSTESVGSASSKKFGGTSESSQDAASTTSTSASSTASNTPSNSASNTNSAGSNFNIVKSGKIEVGGKLQSLGPE